MTRLCPRHCGLAPQSLSSPNEKRLRVKPAMTEAERPVVAGREKPAMTGRGGREKPAMT